jgi:hypothetical protein
MNNNKITQLNNYFSDDEKISQDYNLDDDDDESDYSIDEETRRIIYQSINKNINSNNKLNKQKKNKNIISLNDFVQKVNAEKTAKQPKKFISKRADEKKILPDINDIQIIKKSFNPRLPPYNFVHGIKDIYYYENIVNDQNFPSL